MFNNKVNELLKIEHPIIQAPMAGGITTSELVAAVSNAGGLGMIGAGYMTPLQLKEQIKEIRKLTSHSFGVNLFVPTEFHAKENEVKSANQLLNPIREKLNLPPKENVEIPSLTDALKKFNEQIKVIIEEKVPICSFTFGLPSKAVITKLKQHQMVLMGTATSVKEAIAVEESGLDLVVVQGSEAGGHRGAFMNNGHEGLIGLISLIPQVADSVKIPVIAAGGIMDGRGLMASICLGAQAVQMGTAFLTCIESGAHPVHRDAILNASDDETVVTRSFSGKWARGLVNPFIENMKEHENDLPEFPVQNSLTQDIRKASSSQNNKDFMSLWSGQSPRLAKHQSVANLIDSIISEVKHIK
ncbi:NAD(P)H-dependent flavin oxidoreductase [Fredinandcohnia onubensis]|uniref:NAD(P)H-dependent flavin oxidoreductase n=1 Tax=Fredinandcohnia onubensis TaxID=1571209 RepID=UPI000C0BDE86|nr:nitronate monooxygenase [Fredinandcohnia onubensis]